MKIRYRKSGQKVFAHNSKKYIFGENWEEINDISLYHRLTKYPDVFDCVCYFDYQKLIPVSNQIKIEKNLIFTGDTIAKRLLDKLPFIVKQATINGGQAVYRIVNYSVKKLNAYSNFTDTVNTLIYRTCGGLGDIIMTFPVIEAAKKQNPNYKITYSCLKEFLELAENNPFIDNIEPFGIDITKQNWECNIDLSRDCIKYEIDNQPNVILNRPEIFMQSVDFKTKNTPRPKIYLTKEEIDSIKFDLRETIKVGLILESNAAVRTWDKIYKLRDELQEIYGDKLITFEISKTKPKNYKPIDNSYPVFGKTLRELSAIINKMDLVIGPDTGPMHMASALNIPTLWLFTHIDGKIRTKNYNPEITHIIQGECKSNKNHDKNKACWYSIPCSDGYLERQKNPLCSQSINVDDVLKKAQEILSKPNISYCVVYANDKNIGECLDRIKKYKRKTDEIVIVNNGCKSYTDIQIKEKFDKNEFQYFENDKNLGCVIARDIALRSTDGMNVFVVDDDQFINSDSLHKLQSIEADIVGTEAWTMDKSGYAKRHESGNIDYVGGGGFVCSKKILEDIGFIDKNYSPAWFEDADMCYKAMQNGYSLGYHPNPNIEHLEHRTIFEQNDFDSQEAWRNSHKIFCEKWLNKKIYINTGKKAKINIRIDVEGWAWYNKAIQLQRYLSDEFDIQLVFDGNSCCDLYFSFEKFRPQDSKKKYITGITAHVWNEIPDFINTAKNAVAIHANSMLLFNEIKHLNPNCYYVPNGVDEKLFGFQKRNIKKKFLAGYVGKDHIRKGLRSIIEPACGRSGIELKTQACRFDSCNKINHSQMPDFYKDIDVIMIASDMDGTPNQLLEAAACGRTFIGNEIGNIPEFYNGKNGIVIKDLTIENYSDMINSLKKDRKLCREMGIEARKEIEKNWTWKIQSENYRKMFRECL